MPNDLSVYNQLRPNMKTGDCLGFQNTGIIPWLIRWKTSSDGPIPLSHWGGIIRYPEYEGGEERRFTVEAEADGFYPRILSDYIKDYDGHIYYYALKDDWDIYRNKIGADIMSMYGKGYDWLGVAKRLLGIVNINMRRLYCSVAWQVGLQNTAPTLCNKVDGALSPAGMNKLGCFKNPVKII